MYISYLLYLRKDLHLIFLIRPVFQSVFRGERFQALELEGEGSFELLTAVPVWRESEKEDFNIELFFPFFLLFQKFQTALKQKKEVKTSKKSRYPLIFSVSLSF